MEPSRPANASGSESRITRAAWLALIAAFLGWMFDGFEMGLFPMVARPALTELMGGKSADPNQVLGWVGIMTAVFLVGAATGGVVFGWLGDRIGRIWAMTLSVLTYAVFMGLCGLSPNVQTMFILRFLASLGMGGEWSLGVALVMESWPNRSRAFMAGLIGAAANVGFLIVGMAGLALGQVIESMESWLLGLGLPSEWVNYVIVDGTGAKSAWRLLMILGSLPALLTFLIRLAVPESERWLHSKKHGAGSHWATRDMLGVVQGAAGALFIIYLWAARFEDLSANYGAAAVLTIRIGGSVVGFALALVGFIYPVLRFVQRARKDTGPRSSYGGTLPRMVLGACLSGVALIGTWASLQNAPTWADQLVEQEMKAKSAPLDAMTAARSQARALTGIFTAVGAILGTVGAALLGNAIGRRPAYVLLCIGSLAAALAFFQLNKSYGFMFLWMSLVAGGVTASFYGWLPLYLPELFRTQVRATGQGFSFNFGRILAAIGALQFKTLVTTFFAGDTAKACSVMSLVYLVGLVIIWFVPETKGQPLPE
jgi:MFS family permease